MGAKKENGQFKLLLQSFDPANAAAIRELIQKLLGVGQGQASDIMDSIPIILLDGIETGEKAEEIAARFKEATDLGAEIMVTDAPHEHTPALRWPEEPEIARASRRLKVIAEGDEILTLAKYNFVVDRRNVFRCPGCGRMFLIRELTAEENQEAMAQAEIAERLEHSEPEPPAAAAAPAAPAVHEQSPAPPQKIEEMEPIQELQPQGEVLPPANADMMDLAAFEEGLSSIEYEGGEVPELALPPDTGPVGSEAQAQEFFKELESLPAEEGAVVEAGHEPAPDEAVQKESELEELAPEEAMKFFEGRRDKTEEEEAEEKRRIVAPRRGAARRRMQRLRDKQEEKRRPSSGRGGEEEGEEEEEQEEAPAEGPEHTEGFHGVVLSRIGSHDRRRKAAKYIVELTGMHPEEAREMCEGTFVNVLRGISEEEANEIAGKFKEMGVSAKVTFQKRKKRQSQRMERKRR
jgi:ribosomal protein L7/L12